MQPELGLAHDLARTARKFRLGMEADGNDGLVVVVDGLCELLDAVGGPTRIRLEAAIADMLAAQERGDLLRIADLAEFELLPLVT